MVAGELQVGVRNELERLESDQVSLPRGEFGEHPDHGAARVVDPNRDRAGGYPVVGDDHRKVEFGQRCCGGPGYRDRPSDRGCAEPQDDLLLAHRQGVVDKPCATPTPQRQAQGRQGDKVVKMA